MKVIGVDVSHWEGSIDWKVAEPTLGFAYYKATQGISFIDDQFQNNKAGCQASGLPHAAYHYFIHAMDPLAQARHFIKTCDQGYNRYIIDVEEKDEKYPASMVKEMLDQCELITGIKPAIYTSADAWSYLTPKPKWSKEYDLIVAHYTTAKVPLLPVGWATHKIWQFTDKYYFQGCNEIADGDWFNGALDQVRAWFGNYNPVDPIQPIETGAIEMKVVVSGLNVRTIPSIAGVITGYLHKDDKVLITDIAGQDAWAKHAMGWSAIKVDSTVFMEATHELPQ